MIQYRLGQEPLEIKKEKFVDALYRFYFLLLSGKSYLEFIIFY